MSIWKNYYLAQSISDALTVSSGVSGTAQFIAGGTDLLLDLQQGRHSPVELLVDITEIAEMRCLEVRDEYLFIGAAVPLNFIVDSPLVQQHAAALVEAASLIGGPQVRNTATLGGNVAHALPAGDGTISLLALDAQAEIASLVGSRLLPMGKMFLGPGRSALDPQKDLLVGFHLPIKKPGEGSAFRRVMRPQGVAIAILNMAAWVRRTGDTISSVRISAGPAGPIPFRAQKAEEILRDRELNEDGLRVALEALLLEARYRTSPHRATMEYRRKMSDVLLRDVLQTAWERAGRE
jgi:carbon-monoxide dehydrogenase medium subunit